MCFHPRWATPVLRSVDVSVHQPSSKFPVLFTRGFFFARFRPPVFSPRFLIFFFQIRCFWMHVPILRPIRCGDMRFRCSVDVSFSQKSGEKTTSRWREKLSPDVKNTTIHLVLACVISFMTVWLIVVLKWSEKLKRRGRKRPLMAIVAVSFRADCNKNHLFIYSCMDII